MNFDVAQIGFGKQENFVIIAASWLFFGFLFQNVRPPHEIFLCWVGLTSLFSMLSLRAIGYFQRYTPQPELSSVVSLFLVLPISGLYSKWLIGILVSGISPIRYVEAFRAAFWVALVFEASQWAIFRMHQALGRRWTLLTYLSPQDLELLRGEVKQSDSAGWINIHPAEKIGGEASRLNGRETVVISRESACNLEIHPEFVTAHLRGQRIVDVAQLLKEFRGRIDLSHSDAWTFLLESTYQTFLIRLYFHVKEFAEPVISFFLLLALAPVFIALALLIYLTEGGPVFYRQERSGYRGKKFLLCKLRTMSPTAEAGGPQWAKAGDPRVTPLGRWLRTTRLDELPQLFNVLRGELSFVGPRPERPEFYNLLAKHVPLFDLRLLVRPGITGWAQVRQGYAASIDECKIKLEYDLYYIQNMSPRLDLQVIVHTLALMLRGNSGR